MSGSNKMRTNNEQLATNNGQVNKITSKPKKTAFSLVLFTKKPVYTFRYNADKEQIMARSIFHPFYILRRAVLEFFQIVKEQLFKLF